MNAHISFRRLFKRGTFVVLGVSLLGCSRDLSRENALAIARSQIRQPVSVVVPEEFLSDGRPVSTLYNSLISESFLSCHTWDSVHAQETAMTRTGVWECSAGPNGGGFPFSFVAGYLVPTAVSGIQKASDTIAFADVTMTLEPSPLWRQYSGVVQRFWNAVRQEQPGNDMFFSGIRSYQVGMETQRNLRLQFVRYDDGWRLQQ